MADQSATHGKNWLYFGLGAGSTLLIGIAALGGIYFFKTQNQPPQAVVPNNAGTWKLTLKDAPQSVPSITIIVSDEGNVTAINPQNQEEAVEIGTIEKVSDTKTVPMQVKFQNPFISQARRAKESEAKLYVSSMNRGQQAFFLEKLRWGKTVAELQIGIKEDTENYRYSTRSHLPIKTLNVPNNLGITIQTATSKKDDLKSYIGVVYLVPFSDQPNKPTYSLDNLTSLAITCESLKPTNNTSGLPKFEGKEMLCPDGYKKVS
ncbi:MAG: type IV pilin-like G/H family protein [Pseudanabaenaceae cyanobacterium bins.39]|nr:type IV pilin-like G/H family protein [Pseudanabaenaceae cyanobacterium bins.39]